MNEPLVILGSGAFNAVGLSAAQICAAIRASISGFVEWDLSHLSDEMESTIAAVAPLLPPPRDNQLFNRLVEMATSAISECIFSSGITPNRTVLFLGIREPFRTHPYLDGRDIKLLRAIEEKLQVRFHRDSCVVPEGKPSAFIALAKARLMLVAGKAENCIIGGVDSLVNWYDFNRFSATYRLRSKDISQGFIPGEGAAFVAVTFRSIAPKEVTFLGEILGIGWTNEDAEVTPLSNGYPTGKGLQRALEATIQDARMPESHINFRVSDLNGEYYRGIEYMLGTMRFYRTRHEQPIVWFPAACVGETGAAIGALLIIVAITGMAKGYAPGDIVMCEASSDTGLTAACLIAQNSKEIQKGSWGASKKQNLLN